MRSINNEIMPLIDLVGKFEINVPKNELNRFKVISEQFKEPLTWDEFKTWCQTHKAETKLIVLYEQSSTDLFITHNF